MSRSPWTRERVATLERLWTDGLSASEISARLPGTTRNAVLGKLHRLGHVRRGGPMASVQIHKPKRLSAPTARRPKPPPASTLRRSAAMPTAPMPTWAGEVTSLEALQSWHCRWPIGDPQEPGFAFCGRPVAIRPYCGDHRAVAYRPPSETKAEGGAKGKGSSRGQA
jgi:GcrA cell cycle regulator